MTIRRHRLALSLLGVGLCAAVFPLLYLAFYPRSNAPQVTSPPLVRSVPAQDNAGLPVRLMVPKLAIDAAIEYMGVTAAGEMDVPSNVIEAGWYKFGAHPGDVGTAVIAGHLDGAHGEPGVFLHLDGLRIGDQLSTLDDTGKTSTFVVRESRTYSQDAIPAEVFHSTSGVHLNLITCTGAWDKAQKRFTQRLVVFADKF